MRNAREGERIPVDGRHRDDGAMTQPASGDEGLSFDRQTDYLPTYRHRVPAPAPVRTGTDRDRHRPGPVPVVVGRSVVVVCEWGSQGGIIFGSTSLDLTHLGRHVEHPVSRYLSRPGLAVLWSGQFHR